MKKWALFFLLIVLVSVAAINSVLPPSGLKIVNPASEVGSKKTPTIRVMGVQRGDLVKIYTDSSCLNQVGEGRARYQLVHITTSSLQSGNYLFYAKIIRRGEASACSLKSAKYKLITEPEQPALSLSMQDPNASADVDTTPTLRVKGVSKGDLVRLYRDANCTQMVGSQTAGDAMLDLTVSVPLSPGNYSFYVEIVGEKRSVACFASGLNYTVNPIVKDDIADYVAGDNKLDAFEKNRLWALRVAENPWSGLSINVVTMLTPMSFLATRIEKRREAARALALNEHGLVDSVPLGEPDSRILQQGTFVKAPLVHEWQRKAFSPLEGKFKAQVLEVGKYSAKIRFPLIPEADWYFLEITNLKTMTDESLLILIYPPDSGNETYIEYLLVGLKAAWEYTIQINAMARGVFFLEVGRAHASVHFKTGGNPVSGRSF